MEERAESKVACLLLSDTHWHVSEEKLKLLAVEAGSSANADHQLVNLG